MPNCTLNCLGVGDGFPNPDRNHSAFLYRFPRAAVLLDCGEPVCQSYKRAGFSFDLIDGLVLSHLHSDHVGGFFMLIQGFWLERRRKPLPVYLPAGAVEPMREMLQATMLFDDLLPFKLELRPLQPGKPVSFGRTQITPFATTHLERLRTRFQGKVRHHFEAYCFLLEHCKRRIGHSADLGRPEDLEPLLAQPLDLLVCELAHFAPAELFAFLRNRNIGKVLFMHVGRQYWRNLGPTKRLAAKMLKGIPHRFARDGEKIQF